MNIEGILLPFQHLSDDNFSMIIQELNFDLINHRNNLDVMQLNEMIYDQFDFHESHNTENCPDNNFFNNYSTSVNQCKYLLPNEFNDNVKNSYFTCCQFNINSIPKHFQEFDVECINSNCSFDAIGFCETKLTADIEHLYEMNNYNRYNNSKSRNSGGVAMYIHNRLPNQCVLDEFTRNLDFIESLFIQLDVGNTKVICGIVYHRPGTSAREFINEINGQR